MTQYEAILEMVSLLHQENQALMELMICCTPLSDNAKNDSINENRKNWDKTFTTLEKRWKHAEKEV